MIYPGGQQLLAPMLIVKKRLGASILLSCLSFLGVLLLFPNSIVSGRLQKITVGYAFDDYGTLFRWGKDGKDDDDNDGEGEGDGALRMVVFGDSWVDDSEEKGEVATVKGWTEILCEELLCTTHLNFAHTQSSSSWPSEPPTGVLTSNDLYTASIASKTHTIADLTPQYLPDLSSQIQTFLELPIISIPTIYVVSLGFWDIYHLSTLDITTNQPTLQSCLDSLFAQLDILYSHHLKTIEHFNSTPASSKDSSHKAIPEFQLILPTTMDPTFAPGWLTHRPVPLKPGNVAEEQKSAVHLTESWNKGIKTRIKPWMATLSPSPMVNLKPTEGALSDAGHKELPEISNGKDDTKALAARRLPSLKPDAFAKVKETGNGPTNEEIAKSMGGGMSASKVKGADEDKKKEKVGEVSDAQGSINGTEPYSPLVSKNVFMFDIQEIVLVEMAEHCMNTLGISDANGLGKGKSAFQSVYLPCVHSLEIGEEMDEGETENGQGMVRCKKAEKWLWWDAWNLGSVVKSRIGWGISSMIKEGKGLR